MNKLIVLATLLISTHTTLADINSEIVNAVASADGSTALIFAVYGGVTEIVSTLIKAGADVDRADAGTGSGDGRTALSYAEEKEHAEIVDVLKQAGAGPVKPN